MLRQETRIGFGGGVEETIMFLGGLGLGSAGDHCLNPKSPSASPKRANALQRSYPAGAFKTVGFGGTVGYQS